MRFVGLMTMFMVGVLCAPAIAFAADVPEPDGYRMSDYKADVPATLQGARVLSTVDVAELSKSPDVIFIDVLARPPRPKLAEGTVFQEKPRDDLPGSVWLPDVGFGALSPEMEQWFHAQLLRLSGGNKGKPLVFYCLSHCWMSWNAAKRAVSYGYRAVMWYPDGADGWQAAGHPLERREPQKRPID